MNKTLSIVLILIAVAFEVGADVLFKKWSINSKLPLLLIGLGVYFVGTLIWAYSLKYDLLSKSIAVFTLLNLVAISLIGALIFKENLTVLQKVGLVLGIISILLIEA